MADNAPRGRGRGRGRGRAAAAQPPAAQPMAAPAPAPVEARGRGRGARGRGVPAAEAAPAAGAARGRVVAGPQGAGDLAGQVGRLSLSSGGNGNGNGNGGATDSNGSGVPIGRGSVRPSREGGGVLVTLPKTMTVKQGTEGQHVELRANYFRLPKMKTWSLCKHQVDVNPSEDRTFVKKRLLFQHREKFQGYLFDGSTLFTFQNACPNGKPKELVSRYRIGKNDDGSWIEKDYVLTITFTGTVEQTDYQHLQVFNIVLRDCMEKMELTQLRREYYDMKNCVKVPEHGLEVYPGYSTSFLQCEEDVMLQTALKFKVTRQDTVYNLFRRMFDGSRDGPRDRNAKDSFSAAVIGCVVMTNYREKTYRIDEVDFSAKPTDTFQQKVKGGKGTMTNVQYCQYLKEKYGVTCKDLNQPMLISRSNAKQRRAGEAELIYLIPEFCIFTGLTDDMRKDFRLMKAVNQTTCLDPRKRMDRLREFNRKLTSIKEVQEKLTSWGLKLENDLVKIDGRILPMESIHVTGQKHQAGRDANWDRSLRSNNMLQSVNINRWVIVVQSRFSREAKEFYNCLIRAATGMKYTIAQPFIEEINRDGAGDFVRGIIEATNKHNPQIVMCIVPNTNADRYSAVKRHCILDKPMPSQVILTKNIQEKKAMSVATKVAIQMNCKLGGAPWGVAIPIKNMMVIGYDVCHDPKDKRRSYGAMVSTLDSNCVRWYSNVSHHSAGEEYSINFALGVQKCLLMYKQANQGGLPDKIIIYRDGVGEGQIEHVLGIEVQGVEDKLTPLYKEAGKTLQMAFVVVTKRINTRIFMNGENPPPGTIVDSCITNPYSYDFFLISQSVNQGTVTPTHYNVIKDTSGIIPNYMQRLTYKFTHLYFNWSGTVRVPAPCQYAHKLAFLTSQSVMQTHSNLDRLLYFL